MDLHLVGYFIAVVDHGGVTRAARSLYISQPSLSQAIRTLERRLGVELFDRTGRRLELTAAGRRFESAARRILADVDRAKNRVDSVRTLASGRVDVVTYSAFSIDPMVELVRTFRERHPGISVRILDAAGPNGAAHALRHGDAEIAVTDMPAKQTTPRTLPIGRQEIVLALPDDLAASLPDPVPRERLRDIPLIVDLADPGNSALAGELLGESAANVVIDCAHPSATRGLVSRSAGAAVVPRLVARQEFPDVTHRAISPPVVRRVGLTLRAGPASPAAAAFAAVAEERTRQRAQE